MKLPITYVIANNGGYRIIKQRLLAFHGNSNFIGMDFVDPRIDFAALAQVDGHARRDASPSPMRWHLRCAARSRRPARSCSTSWSTRGCKLAVIGSRANWWARLQLRVGPFGHTLSHALSVVRRAW